MKQAGKTVTAVVNRIADEIAGASPLRDITGAAPYLNLWRGVIHSGITGVYRESITFPLQHDAAMKKLGGVVLADYIIKHKEPNRTVKLRDDRGFLASAVVPICSTMGIDGTWAREKIIRRMKVAVATTIAEQG